MLRFSVVLLGILISLQAPAQKFVPGLWKSRTTLRLNGIPMPDSRSENCISDTQAKDARATLEEELKKQGCFLTKWQVNNKNLEADVKCDNQNLLANGKLSGPFTESKYELRGEAKGKYKRALPSIAAITMTGEWVADKECDVK
ncbi:MAG: hypothetical protein K0R29_401 [Pseudobdellovibrio sp.]|jgi:hypothetical protein|nr:hypothetical protein [Pseudobdellovibrio sp.]